MNVSNVTRLYHNNHYTEPADDLVTLNFSVTPSVTFTPVTFDNADVPDHRRVLSTSTEGEDAVYNQAALVTVSRR